LKYKLTVGNICATLLLGLSLAHLIWSDDAGDLSGGIYGIWLVVIMVLIDLTLQFIIKKTKVLNLIELVTLAAFAIIGSIH
jgi:hypothetical protein